MKNLLWELFEIAVNFFQGFIMIYFAYRFLGDKRSRTYIKSGLIYSIIISIGITLFNRITFFEHFLALVHILIIFIYSAKNLKGSILSKMFVSVFPLLIILVSTAFTGNFISVIFNTPLREILSYNSFERCVAIIVEQLIIIYCVLLFLKATKNNSNERSELAVGEWALISVVLLVGIIMGAFLNFISLENISHDGRLLILFTFVGIIFVNIAVCYLVIDLGKKNEAIRENEILKVQQEYNSQYITNSNIEYDVIRKLRHDFKDSCSVIRSMLLDGNSEKAVNHIENYLGELVEPEIFVKTNNDVVNAVINSKFTVAKSLGVNVRCLCVSDFRGITDIDLCRLLSNMLENAVEACSESKRTDKQIYLKITYDEYKYCFILKNTIDNSVIEHNPKLNSRKKNTKEHGYGTKIIHDIAEKYNGQCDFYEDDDFFCCSVILKK